MGVLWHLYGVFMHLHVVLWQVWTNLVLHDFYKSKELNNKRKQE